MSTFLAELDQTECLMKNPLISKELVKAYTNSFEWARKHSSELENAGWTVGLFYHIGNLAFPYSDWGPGWLPLWSNEKCETRLSDKGNMEFVLHEAGGDVVQTIWLQKTFLSAK